MAEGSAFLLHCVVAGLQTRSVAVPQLAAPLSQLADRNVALYRRAFSAAVFLFQFPTAALKEMSLANTPFRVFGVPASARILLKARVDPVPQHFSRT
jgi:hypothetical protein